jgi:hypothetical protein
MFSVFTRVEEGWSFAAYRTRLDNLLQCQVHPGVALHQVAVECFAILELNQHGMALRRVQEAEGQLGSTRVSGGDNDEVGSGPHHLGGVSTWGAVEKGSVDDSLSWTREFACEQGFVMISTLALLVEAAPEFVA